MRRFVAIGVPDEVRSQLLDAVRPLKDEDDDALRWSRPEGWHVTLAFLGPVDDALVPDVVEVVRTTLRQTAPPRRLHLGQPGRFGRGVLWVGVGDEPQGSVSAVGAAIQRALGDAGLPVHEQPVEPHITLARARRKRGRAVTQALLGRVEVPALSWPVATIELWRSRLGDGPARYEADAVLPVA